ncbi:unnamed protein product [Sphenostylis stenocarpa]|uniref:Uncharacterized protein n=1 Tax=Sphenostylis stenocarpa TaxID=92480 RepID=A0AA86VH85_9FABA|nr:unnamed protein product [Sphenostylis stenocarpa]
MGNVLKQSKYFLRYASEQEEEQKDLQCKWFTDFTVLHEYCYAAAHKFPTKNAVHGNKILTSDNKLFKILS